VIYVAGTYGVYAGGELAFTLGAELGVQVGDTMLVLGGKHVDTVWTAPADWTALANAEDGGDYEWDLWQKIAEQSDLDSLADGTLVLAATAASVAVLVVLRGGPTDPLVENVTSFAVSWVASGFDKETPSTLVTTHAEDVVLAAFWAASPATSFDSFPSDVTLIEATQTVPSSGGIFTAILVSEHDGYAPLGAAVSILATTNASSEGRQAGACLRARAMPRPVGASDPVPGGVGLEGVSAAAAAAGAALKLVDDPWGGMH
jgi:hypothetical protein